MAEQPPAMIVREVAGFLAVDKKTIYRLDQQGKQPGCKGARFHLQDFQGWMDEQKKQALKFLSKN